jgi:hypothetical protein
VNVQVYRKAGCGQFARFGRRVLNRVPLSLLQLLMQSAWVPCSSTRGF